MKEYVDVELLKENFVKRIDSFEDMAIPLSEFGICVGQVIKNTPKADVLEVRRGEWIDVPYTYFGAKRYECNQCSDDEYWQMRFHTVKENYCPNCGAKMNSQ